MCHFCQIRRFRQLSAAFSLPLKCLFTCIILKLCKIRHSLEIPHFRHICLRSGFEDLLVNECLFTCIILSTRLDNFNFSDLPLLQNFSPHSSNFWGPFSQMISTYFNDFVSRFDESLSDLSFSTNSSCLPYSLAFWGPSL